VFILINFSVPQKTNNDSFCIARVMPNAARVPEFFPSRRWAVVYMTAKTYPKSGRDIPIVASVSLFRQPVERASHLGLFGGCVSAGLLGSQLGTIFANEAIIDILNL
jgi:hypothetical protein